MKTLVYFYILLGQCYATKHYEKPPRQATVSGVAIAVPTKAVRQELGVYYNERKDTTYVIGFGWSKLRKVQLFSKINQPNF